MDRRYLMNMQYPSAQGWREALPIGNGIVGASVYGAVWDETILLTHADLYWGGKTPPLPDVSDVLPQIRKHLADDDPLPADALMRDTLFERGYHPQISFPLPLCDLRLKMRTEQGFTNYSRCLDMQRGEVSVRWNDGDTQFMRKCFMSYDLDMLVLQIETQNNVPFDCTLQLAPHPPEQKDIPLPTNIQSTASENMLVYTAQNDDGTDFGAVARIISQGGERVCKAAQMTLRNCERLTLFLKPFIKGRREVAVPDLTQDLAGMTQGYDELFDQHCGTWTPRMCSASLNLNAPCYDSSNEQLLLQAYSGTASLELIEKLWNYGRYLLLSASKTGGNPCNLYGLWCGDYRGLWAFNMVNENLQMLYWQTLTGNMCELLLPVFDYVDRLMEDFRENARKLYGCRGIYIPAPTCPDSGLVKHVTPHILYWTGGAGWLAQHYWDYYLCTQDIHFLKTRALPYLREVALFYEDFFTIGEDGFYLSCPSNSPENSPGNYWNGEQGMGEIMETTMNATMDFAIAKETLTHLIEGCVLCNVDDEDVEKWKKMCEKIPPYQVNEDGAVKEWMHPFYLDNYKHRHQSHLYPLFPGNEIQRDTNPELYEAFVIAVKKRLKIGLNQQTGWSLAHMSNNYARMKESALSLDCLDLICRSCVLPNFMSLHNDWRHMGIGVRMDEAPIQLDANLGLTAALNEMLMQSYKNTLYILPALPARLSKGYVKRLRSRQGILVSIYWEDGYIRVTLENPYESKCIMLCVPQGYVCTNNDLNLNGLTVGVSAVTLEFRHVALPRRL